MNVPRTPGPRAAWQWLNVIVLVGAIGCALALFWIFRDRGWFAHDEGLLGQTAERILHGQVPHRDFVDPYTGGLGIFHALAFRVAGVTVNTLRTTVALVAAIWLVGCGWLARSWLPEAGVALLILLVAVWSVPMYPAAMPSWYVLFLVTAAGAALLAGRGHPDRAAIIAGLLIGVAALAKVTAIFGLAGATWALVALGQVDGEDPRGEPIVVALAIVTTGGVLVLIRALIGPPVLAHIVVPVLAAIVAVAGREVVLARRNGWSVDHVLWRRAIFMAAACALPISAFALWLASHDALRPFAASLHDVVGRRTDAASLLPPSPWAVVVDVPIAAGLVAVRRWSRLALVGLGILTAALVIAAGFNAEMHVRLWDALQSLLPAAGIGFAVWWIRASPRRAIAWQAVAIFAPLCAFMALSRYPFAAPIYFLYALPLLLLAISAAVATRSMPPGGIVVVAIGLLTFGVVEVLPGAPENLAMYTELHADRAWLTLPRAHLLVPTDEQRRYQRLVADLDSLPPGPIWAGPDAPEVAFLSGRRDLNSAFFSFLAPRQSSKARFGADLIRQGVIAVVVDTEPSFSDRLSAHDLRWLSGYSSRMTVVDQFHLFTFPHHP